MRFQSLLSLTTILSFWAIIGWAQPMDYFRNLSVSDGLPSNFVTSINEDGEGYMWIGTEDGLARYDGLTFEKFFHDPYDSTSIGFDRIAWDIAEDEQGRIWVSLYGQGFSRYDPLTGDFSSFTFANGRLPAKWVDHVQNFLFAEDGSTYINCVDGIIRVDRNDQIEVISHIRNPELANQPGELRVAAMMDERWIWCTSTSGLARYDIKASTWEFSDQNPNGMSGLAGAWLIHSACFHEDVLWFTSFYNPQSDIRYLYRYGIKNDNLDSIPIATDLTRNKPFSDLTNSILVANDGQVSLATVGLGVLTYNEHTEQWSQQLHSNNWGGTIAQGEVRILYQDRSENLWVGSESGLGVTSSKALFRNYPQATAQQGGFVALTGIRNASVDQNDGLWLGIEGEGLFHLGSARVKISGDKSDLNGTNYHEPLLIEGDQLIYHVWFDGLRKLDSKTGKISRIPANEDLNLPELRNVFRSRTGQIYAWGRNRFGKLNSGTWEFEFVPTPGSAEGETDMVLDVSEDGNGNLWLGTAKGGLICIDPNEMSIIDQWKRDTVGYPTTSVSKVVCKENQVYFSVYGEGLWSFEPSTKKLRSFAKHDGLCSNGIDGLITDQSEDLWIFSSSGLSWFDEENEQFRTFTETDGMVSQQIRDAELLSTGNILLITDKGLIEFEPKQLKKPRVPAKPKLRSLVVFDEEVNLHALSMTSDPKVIRVAHDKNYLRAEFSGMEFFDPERIKFAYRLDGVEEYWNETDNRPVATYSNLSGGNYKLCVKQTNPFGEWGPELCIPIFVTTPIYFQPWFVVLALLLALLLGYWIYRWQLSKRMAVMHVRNRVSRDLHDDIGSTLSSINIFSSVAQDQLGEREEETKKVLEQISEGAEEMMQSMDDIVWVINPKNDAIANLQTRMLAYAVPILEAKDIDLRTQLITNDSMLKLSMEKRKNLFLIFKEVVNNMAKHSGATQAFISLEINGNEIGLSVQDNGCGFDPEATSNRNGIKNLNARAKQIDGEIRFNSTPKKGTTITVKVPIP